MPQSLYIADYCASATPPPSAQLADEEGVRKPAFARRAVLPHFEGYAIGRMDGPEHLLLRQDMHFHLAMVHGAREVASHIEGVAAVIGRHMEITQPARIQIPQDRFQDMGNHRRRIVLQNQHGKENVETRDLRQVVQAIELDPGHVRGAVTGQILASQVDMGLRDVGRDDLRKIARQPPGDAAHPAAKLETGRGRRQLDAPTPGEARHALEVVLAGREKLLGIPVKCLLAITVVGQDRPIGLRPSQPGPSFLDDLAELCELVGARPDFDLDRQAGHFDQIWRMDVARLEIEAAKLVRAQQSGVKLVGGRRLRMVRDHRLAFRLPSQNVPVSRNHLGSRNHQIPFLKRVRLLVPRLRVCRLGPSLYLEWPKGVRGSTMSRIDESRPFVPVRIAVMTVSDTRSLADDRSGDTLVKLLEESGHTLADRAIVPDDRDRIAARLRQWIADDNVEVVISTGGTGVTGRDVTPEAFESVFEKKIEGFGELFRMLSYQKIGTSTIQSRAIGGVARGTYLFALPGSTSACRDGWEMILKDQLDYRHRPCNFVELFPRLREHEAHDD